MTNYRQLFAIQKTNEDRIRRLCPEIDEERCGIYVFTREDESGFKYAYVGQSVNILKRIAEHLKGYQHIDLSIKKHGLYDEVKNPYGWKLKIECVCEPAQLDENEQIAIKKYAIGYQLRNATSGSQGVGKKVLTDYGRGGYRKGKHEGEQKAVKEISDLIKKYTTGLVSKDGKVANRKTAELKERLFLKEENI